MLTTALNIFSSGKLLIIIQYCVTNRPLGVLTRQAFHTYSRTRLIRTSFSPLFTFIEILKEPHNPRKYLKLQKGNVFFSSNELNVSVGDRQKSKIVQNILLSIRIKLKLCLLTFNLCLGSTLLFSD